MTKNVKNINANSSADLRDEKDPRNIEAGAVNNVSHDPIIEGGSMTGNKRTYKDSSKGISQKKRFKVQSVEDRYKWNLPNEMIEYVNSHFQAFLSDKGVHESILLENPIPSNVNKPQVVNEFLTPLMTKAEVSSDLSLEKIQQKVVNVMGPLSKV